MLQNAIVPLDPAPRAAARVNLIYHTTPHRGLQLLVAAFKRLAATDPGVHLDVYSSFGVHGQADRDAPFEPLFREIGAHPQMSPHGAVPNAEVRAALGRAHVFAYLSVLPGTSCRALIEAMSAGLVCVRPAYTALAETAANRTWMYCFSEDLNEHASRFLAGLRAAVDSCRRNDAGLAERLASQSGYVRLSYDLGIRLRQREARPHSLLATGAGRPPGAPGG